MCPLSLATIGVVNQKLQKFQDGFQPKKGKKSQNLSKPFMFA